MKPLFAFGQESSEGRAALVIYTALLVFFIGWALLSDPSTVIGSPDGFPREKINGIPLPAVGVWNGFNRQINIIECSNLISRPEVLRLEVVDYTGEVLGETSLELSARGTSHLVLNDFPGVAENYGTYRLEADGNAEGGPNINCYTMVYRKVAATEGTKTEYAYSVPLEEPLRGTTYGIYNSMNPDGSNDLPVYNWLSIYNPGTEVLNAVVRVYDQQGEEREIFEVLGLSPGDRKDYALGHPDGQITGIYKIVPEDENQKYGAFLSRYSRQVNDSYNFGFMLLARRAVETSGSISASTMGPAINWGEIANVSGESVEVDITVYSRNRQELFSETRTIPAFSQYHLYLNEHLGEANVGAFEVKAVSPGDAQGMLLVQSLYYGHQVGNSQKITWAYADQAKGVSEEGVARRSAELTMLSLPVNTSAGAANWIKLFGQDSSSAQVILKLYDSRGEEIATEFPEFSLRGSADLPIHEQVGPDFLGSLLLSIEQSGAPMTAEMVRVLPKLSQGGGFQPEARQGVEAAGMPGETLGMNIPALELSVEDEESLGEEANPKTEASVIPPSPTATVNPSQTPGASPTVIPTATPTPIPTLTPTPTPTPIATVSPTSSPTASPSASPTEKPTAWPSATPTEKPTASPSASPSPSATPTSSPTASPSESPSPSASPSPSPSPTPPPVCYDHDDGEDPTTASSASLVAWDGEVLENLADVCEDDYTLQEAICDLAAPGPGVPYGQLEPWHTPIDCCCNDAVCYYLEGGVDISTDAITCGEEDDKLYVLSTMGATVTVTVDIGMEDVPSECKIRITGPYGGFPDVLPAEVTGEGTLTVELEIPEEVVPNPGDDCTLDDALFCDTPTINLDVSTEDCCLEDHGGGEVEIKIIKIELDGPPSYNDGSSSSADDPATRTEIQIHPFSAPGEGGEPPSYRECTLESFNYNRDIYSAYCSLLNDWMPTPCDIDLPEEVVYGNIIGILPLQDPEISIEDQHYYLDFSAIYWLGGKGGPDGELGCYDSVGRHKPEFSLDIKDIDEETSSLTLESCNSLFAELADTNAGCYGLYRSKPNNEIVDFIFNTNEQSLFCVTLEPKSEHIARLANAAYIETEFRDQTYEYVAMEERQHCQHMCYSDGTFGGSTEAYTTLCTMEFIGEARPPGVANPLEFCSENPCDAISEALQTLESAIAKEFDKSNEYLTSLERICRSEYMTKTLPPVNDFEGWAYTYDCTYRKSHFCPCDPPAPRPRNDLAGCNLEPVPEPPDTTDSE